MVVIISSHKSLLLHLSLIHLISLVKLGCSLVWVGVGESSQLLKIFHKLEGVLKCASCPLKCFSSLEAGSILY